MWPCGGFDGVRCRGGTSPYARRCWGGSGCAASGSRSRYDLARFGTAIGGAARKVAPAAGAAAGGGAGGGGGGRREEHLGRRRRRRWAAFVGWTRAEAV